MQLTPPSDVTVQCPVSGCHELVTRIERYRVTVEWSLGERPTLVGGMTEAFWSLGALDSGTHFHLFCAVDHETKRWGRDLPARLKKVVYPEGGEA